MHYVQAKSLLSAQNGINIYRGCSHGCIYCDSRSRCYGFKHAFEDIEVKQNAPELLIEALKRKRKKCMISTGAMSDPYLHIESKLMITRRCLEIIEHYGFGLAIQTKSNRILRDIDILEEINRKSKCVVEITLTTFDEDLCRIIEPNVSTTRERFEVLMECRKRGIPTIVWLTPLLPFINDTLENLNGILSYCEEAHVRGIICYGMGVTMREGDREYFYAALDKHFPGLKARYVRNYGLNYELPSPNAEMLWRRFTAFCAEKQILDTPDACFAYMHTFPSDGEQLSFL